MGLVLLYVALIGLMVASNWVLFSKAGEPGWKSIVPIYGMVVFLRIVGRPWWWLLLFLIPVVNLICAIVVCVDLAKAFGKGGGYAAGLALLGPIFMPMLAFGDTTYQGASKGGPAPIKRAA